MENKAQQIVIITGPPASGTSTLSGMLNCHPDVFILWQAYLYQGIIAGSGRGFLKKYPDARYLFRYSNNLQKTYSKLADFLSSQGKEYKIVGDKIPILDIELLSYMKDCTVLFTVRDIRTWLAKPRIVETFYAYDDIVPVAIDYATHFLRSFLLKDKLHIRMEDLILKNDKIIDQLSDFLDIKLLPDLNKWWEKIALSKDHPKNSLDWWRSHPSSLQKPKDLDVQVVLKDHPFWNEFLPIFDKYYNNFDSIDKSGIENDLEKLNTLMKYSPVSHKELYQECKTNITQPKEIMLQNRALKEKTLKHRIKQKIRKVGGALINKL